MRVRHAKLTDGASIAALFIEKGINPYHWSANKWRHYYDSYTEGEPVSLVLEKSGEIIGHYGLLPLKVGEWPVMLGLHAYVAAAHRGLPSISRLMGTAQKVAIDRGHVALCGFANPSFTLIKEKLLKWKTLLWLEFDADLGPSDFPEQQQSRFFFNYSDSWFDWRFGESRPVYLSDYADSNGQKFTQLLKAKSNSDLYGFDLSGIEAWTKKKTHSRRPTSARAQPFSIKVFDDGFLAAGALDPELWKIDMGDSDTFIYNPSARSV